MRQVMVRYTVRPECADENVRLISDVFESLREQSPDGLSYASYRLEDGVSFVHVASMRDEATNPLRLNEAFKRFTAGVKDRCEVLPVTTVLSEIGSYSR